MLVVNASSADPDQALQNAASDPGLHCLSMSHLWDARHKWVNNTSTLVGHLVSASIEREQKGDKNGRMQWKRETEVGEGKSEWQHR